MPWLYFPVSVIQCPICLCTLYCSMRTGRFVLLQHSVLSILFENSFLRGGRFDCSQSLCLQFIAFGEGGTDDKHLVVSLLLPHSPEPAVTVKINVDRRLTHRHKFHDLRRTSQTLLWPRVARRHCHQHIGLCHNCHCYPKCS
jgi:hypothetical protein